jgi:hypothetical protein
MGIPKTDRDDRKQRANAAIRNTLGKASELIVGL